MEYIGQIAIAGILGIVDDAYYKYKALIETGALSKKECYVAYRGDPNKLEGSVLVRLEYPFKEISNLDLGEKDITSNFITSAIPASFEFASSDEVILFGTWEERMKNGFDVPILSRIKNYYDIGKTQSGLHYACASGRIIPYRLYGSDAEIMRHMDTQNIFNIKNALNNYLGRMDKRKDKHLLPRQVTIDEEISLEARILNALAETGLALIKMEPQA